MNAAATARELEAIDIRARIDDERIAILRTLANFDAVSGWLLDNSAESAESLGERLVHALVQVHQRGASASLPKELHAIWMELSETIDRVAEFRRG